MTDANAAPPTPGPDDLIPPSMPFSRRATFADTPARPTPSSTRSPSTVALDERLKVISLLFVKMQELDEALYKLRIIPREGLTYGQLQQIGNETVAVSTEHAVCETRRDQIDRGAPFKPLPPGAQAGLLAAITAVDAHTGAATALSGLLQAIHGLVVAYGGKDT